MVSCPRPRGLLAMLRPVDAGPRTGGGVGEAEAGAAGGAYGDGAGEAAVPSRRRPELITSVARYLADAGRLRWLGTLDPAGQRPAGKPGGNSAFRLAGIWEAFSAPTAMQSLLSELAGGPVLLVDDLVDSRWTMTVAGRALRRAGAGSVLPFALASVA